MRKPTPHSDGQGPFHRLNAFFRAPQVRRTLGVALGAATAHAALLLASPLLTRLFSPADFGVYSFFYAALGFLAPVSTLRYELAIPIPRSERQARQLAVVSLSAAAATAGVVLAGLIVGRTLGVEALRDASWAFMVGVPVGVALAGAYQTATYWAVRHERFRAVAYGRSGMGVGTSLAQIAGGAVALGPLGLILGDLTGRLAAAGILVRGLAPTLRGAGAIHSVRGVLRHVRRFRGFPLMSSPAVLMNSLGLYLPLLAVGHFYGAAAAGMFFLAQRAIGLPSTLLISAASQVYVSELTRSTGVDRVALYWRTIRRLAALTALPFLVGAVLAPPLFPILFGGDWAAAGRIAMLLAPLYFFQLLSGSTISTLDIMEHHGARLLREAVFLAVVLGVFAIPALAPGVSLVALMGMFAGAGSLFYVGSVIFVRVAMGAGHE